MYTRTCHRTCSSSLRNWKPSMASNPKVAETENARTAAGELPAAATRRMTMIQALRSAMDVMLERDPNVVVYGQDVGYFGGVFRCTEGLQAKYGSSRVFDA